MTTLGLALLVLAFTVATLALMVLNWRARAKDRRRLEQMLALCHAQQSWIRRGEVACVDCPELGSCVVQGACERES